MAKSSQVVKRQAVQFLDGHGLLCGKGMSHRQHGLVLVLLEQERVEFRQRRKAQKTAVHPPFVDPMLDLIVVAEQHFILDAGVVLLQYGKDIRQPVDRHARKSPDADHTGLYPIHPVDLPHKLLMVVQPLRKNGMTCSPAEVRQTSLLLRSSSVIPHSLSRSATILLMEDCA